MKLKIIEICVKIFLSCIPMIIEIINSFFFTGIQLTLCKHGFNKEKIFDIQFKVEFTQKGIL